MPSKFQRINASLIMLTELAPSSRSDSADMIRATRRKILANKQVARFPAVNNALWAMAIRCTSIVTPNRWLIDKGLLLTTYGN